MVVPGAVPQCSGCLLYTSWRTIYDNGNLQTDQIRQDLMSGHKLLGVYRAGELLIQPLGESGLYLSLIHI